MNGRSKRLPRMVRISARKLEKLLQQCYDLGRRDGVAEEVARRHRLPPPSALRLKAPLGQPIFSE